jgi:alpha-ribazole phosphatase
MTRSIFYFRHPKPENADGICYGHTDLNISNESRDECKTSLSIFNYPELKIYTSPSTRCASLLLNSQVKFKESGLIKEINFGIYDGTKWDLVPKDLLDTWAKDISGFKFEQGESYLELKTRIRIFFDSIPKDRDILLVTHAGVIRACMDIFFDVPIEEAIKIKIPYGKVIPNLLNVENGLLAAQED